MARRSGRAPTAQSWRTNGRLTGHIHRPPKVLQKSRARISDSRTARGRRRRRASAAQRTEAARPPGTTPARCEPGRSRPTGSSTRSGARSHREPRQPRCRTSSPSSGSFWARTWSSRSRPGTSCGSSRSSSTSSASRVSSKSREQSRPPSVQRSSGALSRSGAAPARGFGLRGLRPAGDRTPRGVTARGARGPRRGGARSRPSQRPGRRARGLRGRASASRTASAAT